jgi:hypothetical protein
VVRVAVRVVRDGLNRRETQTKNYPALPTAANLINSALLTGGGGEIQLG